jgi:hypothetical protein
MMESWIAIVIKRRSFARASSILQRITRPNLGKTIDKHSH